MRLFMSDGVIGRNSLHGIAGAPPSLMNIGSGWSLASVLKKRRRRNRQLLIFALLQHVGSLILIPHAVTVEAVLPPPPPRQAVAAGGKASWRSAVAPLLPGVKRAIMWSRG